MLKNGNRKLGKEIYNFNLPRTTCTGRTVMCEKYCYAKRGGFRFPNVAKCQEQNLQESRKDDFVEQISNQLNGLTDVKYVRLHSSGDFEGQAYYNKWNNIAQQNPQVTFLAFTKSKDIDFSEAASNLKIFFSQDESTTAKNPTLKLQANVFPKGKYETTHMNYIPELNAKVCNSKCKQCNYCFEGTGNVAFERR
jgi:hypothetical protein